MSCRAVKIVMRVTAAQVWMREISDAGKSLKEDCGASMDACNFRRLRQALFKMEYAQRQLSKIENVCLSQPVQTERLANVGIEPKNHWQ